MTRPTLGAALTHCAALLLSTLATLAIAVLAAIGGPAPLWALTAATLAFGVVALTLGPVQPRDRARFWLGLATATALLGAGLDALLQAGVLVLTDPTVGLHFVGALAFVTIAWSGGSSRPVFHRP